MTAEQEVYDLDVDGVVERTGATKSWVRAHAISLGGVKRRWSPYGRRAMTFRFPSEGIEERVTSHQARMNARRGKKGTP